MADENHLWCPEHEAFEHSPGTFHTDAAQKGSTGLAFASDPSEHEHHVQCSVIDGFLRNLGNTHHAGCSCASDAIRICEPDPACRQPAPVDLLLLAPKGSPPQTA
jgi:hypothetical protein